MTRQKQIEISNNIDGRVKKECDGGREGERKRKRKRERERETSKQLET